MAGTGRVGREGQKVGWPGESLEHRPLAAQNATGATAALDAACLAESNNAIGRGPASVQRFPPAAGRRPTYWRVLRGSRRDAISDTPADEAA